MRGKQSGTCNAFYDLTSGTTHHYILLDRRLRPLTLFIWEKTTQECESKDPGGLEVIVRGWLSQGVLKIIQVLKNLGRSNRNEILNQH